jgi:4-hydroxy-2-oxoheptanedioate aldolase
VTAAPPFVRLRERLVAGAPLVGTFIKLASLESVDIAAGAGFDLVVIDAEHSQLDEGDVRRLIRHAAARGIPAMVRIPVVDSGAVGRMLEAGAAGFQLSTLRSVRERDALIAATRYAPDGARSVSLAHPAADYGAEPLVQYLERQRPGPVLVGQIETATTEDPLDRLLAGLDVAFIGSTDLSVDLGRPGQLGDPLVRARVDEVATVAAGLGVAFGVFAGSGEAVATLMKDHAARYVLVGSDVQLLRSGASTLVDGTRRVLLGS